jgi:hypothetical protein
MKGLLVRIGVDQAYGGWNAPVDADGRFVYVPIPESLGAAFQPGLERRFGEVLPALNRFCEDHDCNLFADLSFPNDLLHHAMHLDPDFECLTYGDEGARRGAGMVNMGDGDFLVFYGGLRPIHDFDHRLIYALMGIYVVKEVVGVGTVPSERWYENAHVRKAKLGETDIVVRAKPKVSGRFDKCIPIGEWRDGGVSGSAGRSGRLGRIVGQGWVHPAECRAAGVEQAAAVHGLAVQAGRGTDPEE